MACSFRKNYHRTIQKVSNFLTALETPRSKNTGQSGRNTPKHKGSIPAGNIWHFSNDFRPVPSGKHKKVVGMHRQKNQKISGPNTVSMFVCIPGGFSVFSVSSLQVPSGSGDRNLRPRLLFGNRCLILHHSFFKKNFFR